MWTIDLHKVFIYHIGEPLIGYDDVPEVINVILETFELNNLISWIKGQVYGREIRLFVYTQESTFRNFDFHLICLLLRVRERFQKGLVDLVV